MELARPKRLREGDLVGVAASSSPIDPQLLADGVAELEELGFRVRVEPDIDARHFYLAGDDERRAREVDGFLADPEVRAVLCARGGYGWPRILDRIDWQALRRDPKPIVGFSDATVALTAAQRLAGVVAFHGPMVAWDLRRGPGAYDRAVFRRALCDPEPLGSLAPAGLEILRPGTAEGRLTGGCLPLLCATLGTPFAPATRGAILFLEDWRSKPYQIDRALQQLRLAGALDAVRGVVFGRMLECRQQSAGDDYRLQDVVLGCLEPALPADAPIVWGFPSGHVEGGHLTLPLGVRARLAAEGPAPALEILEGAVAP